MKERNRFPAVQKKRAFLKGMGSILHLRADLPVRGYSLEEAVRHDSGMMWRDLTRATESMTEEMTAEQRQDVVHFWTEAGDES